MPCERKHIEAIEAAASALSTQDDRVIFGHDDLLALISTALAAADESPWRSMESAPRDGTHILLCEGGNVSEGGWLTGAMMGAEDESCAGWWSVNGVDNPTHWMPMPAAPEVSK